MFLTPQAVLDAVQDTGGCSLNNQGNPPQSGFMVSLSGHELRVTEPNGLDYGVLSAWMSQHQYMLAGDPALYVGVWKEGKYTYLDLSSNVLDQARAIELGRLYGQLAIWDVVNSKCIDLV